MGGTVKVAIRFEDGTRWADTRWTNSLSGWFNLYDMIERPDGLLREYAATKSDYSTGDDTVAPVDYGIVLIDAVTKTIYCFNDYTTIGISHIYALKTLKEEIDEGIEDNGAMIEYRSYERMLRDGRLSVTKGFTGTIATREREDVFRKDADFGAEVDKISHDASGVIVVDLSPWTILGGSYDGVRHAPHNFLGMLESTGFPLTDKDYEAFEKWLKQLEEE